MFLYKSFMICILFMNDLYVRQTIREGPPLRGPALKKIIYLDHYGAIDVGKNIFFHVVFIHHGHNRIIFHAHD